MPGESGRDVIRGSINIPLSPLGRREAQDVAQRTRARSPGICTSPRLRARQTTQPIAQDNPLLSGTLFLQDA